jgi:hypothetical protein
MVWHTDEQLWASPQVELVLTLRNSLSIDARTEWIDMAEEKHSHWLQPNDALLVEAESLPHRVTSSASSDGERLIIKAAYSDSDQKLESFFTELSET